MRFIELASELQLQLPEWSEEWLTWGSYGLAAFAALWILCGLTTFWIRRSYNLQRIESASTPGLGKPAFLKTDHAAREAAIERGDAYDEARVAAAEAAAEAEPTSASGRKWRLLRSGAKRGMVIGEMPAARKQKRMARGAKGTSGHMEEL